MYIGRSQHYKWRHLWLFSSVFHAVCALVVKFLTYKNLSKLKQRPCKWLISGQGNCFLFLKSSECAFSEGQLNLQVIQKSCKFPINTKFTASYKLNSIKLVWIILVKSRCSSHFLQSDTFSAYQQAVKSETDWWNISARHFLQADFVKHEKMHFKSKLIIDWRRRRRRRRRCFFSFNILQPHKAHVQNSQCSLKRQTPTWYEQISLSTFQKNK